MLNVRTCVIFLVLLVNYRLVASQPTFGSQIWCSMFCGDDDDSDDDSDDYSFLDLFDMCYGCSSARPKPPGSGSSAAATTAKPSQPVKVMIPPSTGLNLTVFSGIGGVLMDLVPWLATPTTAPAAAPAATTAAPATTPAGNGTAAATTAKPK